MNFKERLNKIINESGDEKKVFAEKCGKGESQLYNYLKGSQAPGFDFFNKLKKHYPQVDLEWLISGVENPSEELMLIDDRLKWPEEPEIKEKTENIGMRLAAVKGCPPIPEWKNPVPLEQFNCIPMAEAELSAGGGAFVLSESFKEFYAFRKDWIKKVATNVRNLVIMRVEGDSMEPTIMDGDVVMLDRGRPRITTGHIYALGMDNDIAIKRLELLTGTNVRIISDNKSGYEPYVVNRVDIRIIGQVIWRAGQMIHPD